MPPRLQLGSRIPICRNILRPSGDSPSLLCLFAGLSLNNHARHAHILASLSDNKKAYNKRIRVGRGASSGYGKTSGRGHKGQGQRSKVNPRFQGGQTPLIMSKGKKGFENLFAADLSLLNLDQLQTWIDSGRIDASKQITVKEIVEAGLISRPRDGVKLLARGKESLQTPVDILVSRASATAIEAVEKAGGKIMTRFYTKESIQNLLKGKSISTDKPLPVGAEHVEEVLAEKRKQPFSYRLPDPTHRWDIEYYRDPAHRGYLSHTLKKGQSPSLFFGVPGSKRVKRKRTGPVVSKKEREADIIF